MITKPFKLILFIILFYLLLKIDISAQISDTNAIRGVWMWGSTLAKQDHQAIVDKLATNNVNLVYLLVKGTSGEKTAADLLTGFIAKAHNKNIKIHLWYIVNQDNVYYSAHKDAGMYHNPKPSAGYNDPYPITDGRLNLLYPGYKEYVLDNIKYFLTNFDCDGIHLDCIRYPHLVYSFDKDHLKKAAELGCDTARILNLFRTNYDYYAVSDGFVNLYSNRDPDVVKWVTMRNNVIYDYIKSVKDTIQKIKPGLALTAAFMPEGATMPDYADVYYSQNYALNSKLLDIISPMAYYKDYGQSTSWLRTVTEKAILLVDQHCKISSGTQAYGGVTAVQLGEQLTYAIGANSYGAVIFKYEDITSDQWATVKSIYGKKTYVKKVPTLIPTGYNLLFNYPNPFNPTTNISFELPKESIVNLTILNSLGQEVIKLISGEKLKTGKYNITWNGMDTSGKILSTGIYFYQIQTNDFSATKKMIFLK